MFEFMPGFPEDVLAVSATGHVGAEDYRSTLAPEARRRIGRHGSLRLLMHFGPQFEGMSPGAILADAKLGFQHWGDLGRMAVVSDVGWIANAVRMFAPLLHQPVRVFSNAELDEAKRWIVQRAS